MTPDRRPFTAYHVGRRGEVAGGMTQVVNGYLRWPFERFRVRVIVSRDGSSGPRAALLAAGAAVRLLVLPGRRRSVVVVHLSQGGSFVREGSLLRLAARLGTPVVAHLHGSAFADYAGKEPGRVRRVLAAADLVLALSEESAGVVERMVPSIPVHRVPNVVEIEAPEQKEQRVVFGGAVTRRKGVDVLLEAWQRIAPAGWVLDVAGPPVEPDLVRAVPGVEFHGPLDHAALMALLRRAAVAVLPSRDEALPMFLLEAMARRAAVVSTTVGGIPELLAGERGVVVPPDDVEALAAALHELIVDAERREAVAQAGLARIRDRYSADRAYAEIAALWERAISTRRVSAR